ncbi:MAG: hypothetical protein ACI8V7_000445 [Candidatus Paceibacteria bacterium]|jgi:hypothetical protein
MNIPELEKLISEERFDEVLRELNSLGDGERGRLFEYAIKQRSDNNHNHKVIEEKIITLKTAMKENSGKHSNLTGFIKKMNTHNSDRISKIH